MKQNLKAQYDAKATRIVATTSDVDRDGEVVDPHGVKNFQAFMSTNPVILWQHRHSEAPVGKATGGQILDNRIELDIEWAPTEMGREVKALYDEGFMNSFSIGFIPRKSETRGGQFTWTEWELLEVSAVSIPANPMANVIRAAEESGLSIKSIKEHEAGLPVLETDGEEADAVVRQEITHKENTMELETRIAELESKLAEQDAAKAAEAKAEQDAQVKSLEAQLADARKELDDQKAKAKMTPEPEVKVGASYKGINLDVVADDFANNLEKKGQYKAAEKARSSKLTVDLIKAFEDMRDNAHKMSTQGIVNKDLLEGTTTAGGFLVPEVRHELLNYARLNSVALRRGNVVSMTSDVEKWPRENAKANLSFSNEATPAAETDPTFEEVTLTAQDLDGYSDVSMHLEMDSATPVAAMLLEQFIEAYGQAIDQEAFTDASEGLFTQHGNTVTAGGAAFTNIDYGDLIEAVGSIPSVRRVGAAWYGLRSTIWDNIRNITEDNKRIFVDPTGTAPASILGYPVEETEFGEADGSGACGLVFGNLNGLMIGERLSNMMLYRDPYSQMTAKRVRYHFFTRVATAMALPNNFVGIVTA